MDLRSTAGNCAWVRTPQLADIVRHTGEFAAAALRWEQVFFIKIDENLLYHQIPTTAHRRKRVVSRAAASAATYCGIVALTLQRLLCALPAASEIGPEV